MEVPNGVQGRGAWCPASGMKPPKVDCGRAVPQKLNSVSAI